MISASIVLFNTSIKEIDTIIESYSPSKDRVLFFVDNSSTETEYCKSMKSKYIWYSWNSKNLGYGTAHNIAIKKAIEIGTDYHIVLNPDLKFEPKILNKLVEYAEINKDVVYMLPKVIYPDGELQYLCKLLPTPFDLFFRRFFPLVGPIKKMNDRYILKSSGYNKVINPPCLSGCFMFMRVKTLKENNLLFDERFFMYCEDFDLIRRLHRVGKTIFYPNVIIIHNHAKSSYKNVKMFKLHLKSAYLYFKKYGWIYDKERKMQNKKVLGEME